MLSRAAVVFGWVGALAIGACGGSEKKDDAPAAKKEAAAPAPVKQSEDEKVSCQYGTCKVQLISDAAKAELEKQKAEQDKNNGTVRLEFREGTTDEQLKSIAKVPWVTHVSLGSARKLTSLAPLSALKNLKYLYTGGNEAIKDIAPLSSFADLEELDVSMTGVSDLAATKTMPKLSRLSLYACKQVTDLAPLTDNTMIKQLNLYMVKPKDWSVVSTMTSLERLNIDFSELTDLNLIKPLVNLRELDASWSKSLKDIKALAGLKKLQRFQCIDCPVADLKPMAGLAEMTWLTLSGTLVSDLNPLAKMAALTGMDVQRSKVKSLDPLKKLAKIGTIYAMGTGIKDFKPLLASAQAKSLYYVSAPKGTTDAQMEALKRANPQLKVEVEK